MSQSNQPSEFGLSVDTYQRRLLQQIPELPQRQDATNDQLRDLRAVANRLGMYDAADVLRTLLER